MKIPQTEALLLSCMMKGLPETNIAIAGGVKAESFESAQGKGLFLAIVSAASKVQATSLDAVFPEAGEVATLDDLIAIDNLCSTGVATATHVENLLCAQAKRQIKAHLREAIDAVDENATVQALRESVGVYLGKAQEVGINQDAATLKDHAEAYIAQVDNPETVKTVSTGFYAWDKIATPFKAGHLIILAARPGAGKTALGLQIAHNAAEKGNLRTAFFSVEMSGVELVERMALSRAGKFERENPRVLRSEALQIGQIKNLFIYDNRLTHTPATIEARCNMLASLGGGLGLVVIDYLQIVSPTDPKLIREQQVAEMTRRFKQLAGRLGCPVLLLSQLNRESEKEERMPRKTDLRESGAIEQDADRVLFLWQDAKNTIPGHSPGDDIVITLTQSKCRGGPKDISTTLQFQQSIYRMLHVAKTN